MRQAGPETGPRGIESAFGVIFALTQYKYQYRAEQATAMLQKSAGSSDLPGTHFLLSKIAGAAGLANEASRRVVGDIDRLTGLYGVQVPHRKMLIAAYPPEKLDEIDPQKPLNQLFDSMKPDLKGLADQPGRIAGLLKERRYDDVRLLSEGMASLVERGRDIDALGEDIQRLVAARGFQLTPGLLVRAGMVAKALEALPVVSKPRLDLRVPTVVLEAETVTPQPLIFSLAGDRVSLGNSAAQLTPDAVAVLYAFRSHAGDYRTRATMAEELFGPDGICRFDRAYHLVRRRLSKMAGRDIIDGKKGRGIRLNNINVETKQSS